MADQGIQFLVVPLDNEVLKATPVPDDADQIIFGCPEIPNCRAEVYSIGIAAHVVVVDGTNTALVDLIYHDASADADTTLLTGAAGAAGDLKAAGGNVADEVNTIWTGTRSLDPGDTIRAALTVTTPDTAGEGYAFIIAYRIKEWNGE